MLTIFKIYALASLHSRNQLALINQRSGRCAKGA